MSSPPISSIFLIGLEDARVVHPRSSSARVELADTPPDTQAQPAIALFAIPAEYTTKGIIHIAEDAMANTACCSSMWMYRAMIRWASRSSTRWLSGVREALQMERQAVTWDEVKTSRLSAGVGKRGAADSPHG